MRRIKLDEIITDKLGISNDGPLLGADGKPITMRKALVTHCGMFETNNGEEAIRAFDLGIKIKNAGPTVSIEDADYDFLRKGPMSQPKFVSMILAQVLVELKNAEVVKLESEPKGGEE